MIQCTCSANMPIWILRLLQEVPVLISDSAKASPWLVLSWFFPVLLGQLLNIKD
jgi:hypothetical protein